MKNLVLINYFILNYTTIIINYSYLLKLYLKFKLFYASNLELY